MYITYKQGNVLDKPTDSAYTLNKQKAEMNSNQLVFWLLGKEADINMCIDLKKCHVRRKKSLSAQNKG